MIEKEKVTYEKFIEKTPNGGDYWEIYYFDAKGDPVDKDDAIKCIIRECEEDGTLVYETFGRSKI